MKTFHSIRIPEKVSPGAEIAAADHNALIDALKTIIARQDSARIAGSADIGIKSASGGGQILYIKRPTRSSSPSAGGCSDLLPTLTSTEGIWKIKVSPGFSDSTIPSLNGSELIVDPAPFLTISAATTLWLVIEWEPASESEDDIHWISPGGTLVSANFVANNSRPAETAAEVAEDGTKTNGTYAIAWAEIIADDDSLSIAANRCGNHQVTFCPPSLKLSFD
jgi:hypothetical protein